MSYGHFSDATREYVITNPLTPKPWINYLGNRRLTAFISQNAGGVLWYLEPQFRRISRYHYLSAPPDRPGFYVYVRDRKTGVLWNPHFAPVCVPLDRFECRHSPGLTRFIAEKDGVRVELVYGIPPADDVMLWKVTVSNVSPRQIDVQTTSFLEFGLLEIVRESAWWCYLKHQLSLRYDPAVRAIRYDYHVFEAPFTPRMVFGCNAEVSGFDCSRDAFIGRTGTLASPERLRAGEDLSGSELPLGGHGTGTLGVDVSLGPTESKEFAYMFAIADSWAQTDELLGKYREPETVDSALRSIVEFWEKRLSAFQAETGDAATDRFVNTWNPYNSLMTLEHSRIISTDHMGMDGLRYRDTTQDALAVANIDPGFSTDRMRLVFAQQTRDGGGCFSFFPFSRLPTTDKPRRSDNTVWQIYTVKNLIAETGDFSFLDERVPFRDGGDATVYDHILIGLKHIYDRRGPHGLPTMYHADWNDGLAIFGDEGAETVMLGMQLVYSCREFAEVALRLGRRSDADWCMKAAQELATILNSDIVWNGEWYNRLLLSNGKVLGHPSARQGRIYINPQSWSVISGVGECGGRGRVAMEALSKLLDTEYGIRAVDPPFKGVPEPEDPPLGSHPGIGENGGIFCHANTWAIIAETFLGNGERAFKYYRQLLPEVVSEKAGVDHYGREPYACISSIVGPASKRFGEGGISWLTGTASWMYVAATHYILGIRPTLDGLMVRPCLPSSMRSVRVRRRYRGCLYHIMIDNTSLGERVLIVDGKEILGDVLPTVKKGECMVVCKIGPT